MQELWECVGGLLFCGGREERKAGMSTEPLACPLPTVALQRVANATHITSKWPGFQWGACKALSVPTPQLPPPSSLLRENSLQRPSKAPLQQPIWKGHGEANQSQGAAKGGGRRPSSEDRPPRSLSARKRDAPPTLE